MNQRVLHTLTNPFFIALIISLVVIAIIPDVFNKYVISSTIKQVFGVENRVYFIDLNADSQSERIDSQINDLDHASFVLYNSDGGIVDQFNLNGNFLNESKLIHFQDTDNNGIKEIFALTRSGDSIFINSLEVDQNRKINSNTHFIETVKPFEGKYNINYHFYQGLNKNNPTIYFCIMAGYGGTVRNVYAFDFESNTIKTSPHLTNASAIQQLENLDDDRRLEILLANHSSGNTIDSIYTKRSDYSTWLNVLDHNLDFLFAPIEFRAQGSIRCIVGKNSIIAVFFSREYEKEPSQILSLNKKGNILKKINLPKDNYSRFIHFDNKIGFIERNNSLLSIYNSNLDHLESKTIKNIGNIAPIDANADGTNEWLVFHSDDQTASIYDYDFENPVTFKYSDHLDYPLSYGIKLNGNNKPELYFQKLSQINLFTYENNPLFVFQYLFYVLLYAGTLGIVFLIVKGQKLREAKQRKIEQEIAELQLKTIKNQVDPHFVFNAVNTLSELNLMENKIEADNFIVEFSNLMRRTLSESDKISTSLATELDYVENYLRLQKIRLNNSFDYKIKVENTVDTEATIPKHSLYTYVENAIKYGLTRSGSKDLITISIAKSKSCLVFQVIDTGTGLKAKKDKSVSTGSGLNIMTKIFNLYEKRFKCSITHSLTDYSDDKNNFIGTKAEVKICPKK